MPAAVSRRSARALSPNYLWVSSLAALVLLTGGIWLFPASLVSGGLGRAITAGGALLASVGASRWAARSTSDRVRRALESGARVGAVLGAAAIIGHTLEVFATLQPPIPAILGVATWGLMFLLWGWAGADTYSRDESIVLGIMSSIWAALISSVTTVVFAFIVGLSLMARMQHVLAGALAASGMTDGRAFVIRNMLDGASSHLLIAPAVAVFAGAASGVGCAALKSVGRRTAMALAVCALTILVGGVGALRFASSLERSARPPFVMIGLLSLGVSLTSVSALFAVTRDSRRVP